MTNLPFQVFEEPFKAPYVLKACINKWKLRRCDASAWCQIFDDKILNFRKGSKLFQREPLWEVSCSTEEMTLGSFFEKSREQRDHFLYYDYRHVAQVLDDYNIFETIDWGDVGYPEIKGTDSTIWIGNEGSHTPCHMDSYGFNFIAQLYGRKRWMLVPPSDSESMRPSRVPYEESSIYSYVNFYTPSNSLCKIENIYCVTLEPGDVLYVPRHWWHYVENLDVAISVNSWIPSVGDDESRLEEALVQKFVSSLCQDLSEENALALVNPNQRDILDGSIDDELVKTAIEKCREERSRRNCAREDPSRKEFFGKLAKSNKLVPIYKMSQSDIECYVREKEEKHNYKADADNDTGSGKQIAELLINGFCHPRAIAVVKEHILSSFV